MKKLLVIILIAAAGYFAYQYLLKEKPVLLVNASKVVTTSSTADIDAPGLAQLTYGTVQGTVKNVSDKVVTNIVLKYKMDGKPVEASIYSLEPGEEKNFSTQNVMIRNAGASFYLEEMSYN